MGHSQTFFARPAAAAALTDAVALDTKAGQCTAADMHPLQWQSAPNADHNLENGDAKTSGRLLNCKTHPGICCYAAAPSWPTAETLLAVPAVFHCTTHGFGRQLLQSLAVVAMATLRMHDWGCKLHTRGCFCCCLTKYLACVALHAHCRHTSGLGQPPIAAAPIAVSPQLFLSPPSMAS